MSNRWFSRWFPDRWFGKWFPGWQPANLFTGYGPDGSASFCTDLESGFKVTLDWGTDIEKSFSGREKRPAPRDAPKQSFDGETLLIGTNPAATRAKLGALMAVGAPFLLGLQYESLTLTADSTGDLVFVNPAMIPWCDWLVDSQRVLCKNGDDVPKFYKGVVQAVDEASGTITLDGAPGFAGMRGCEIMPALAIFFEAQQTFDRYPVNVEKWNLRARNAVFDFAPPHAFIDLGTIKPAWAGAKIEARPPGLGGNLMTFEMDPFVSNPAGGVLAELVPTNTTAQMKGDTDTLGDLATLLNNLSSNVKLVGSYDPSAIIASGDGFTQDLAGGARAGLAGSGAVLTTYDAKYVWDWPIVVDTSGQDSIQSMITIHDFGGVPVVVGTADDPDYGRHVMIRSGSRKDWQWLKKFLWSVRGSQKAFWLPTWREDLVWESGAGASIVVSGNVASWYPKQHDRLMVLETGNVPVYTRITAAVYNADGTTTLTLADAVDNIEMISWLELSRFETPAFEVTWTNNVFEMQATARVVQQ